MGGRIGGVVLLALLVLAGRALWIEAHRYQVRAVPDAQIPPALPVGAVVVVTAAPAGRLAVGDVIDFRHPSSPASPLYLRIGSIERVAGSSGYLVRLDSGDAAREPWHAELHGSAVRVIASRNGELVSREIGAAKGVAAVAALAASASLAWRWYRHRPRRVARTYRTDIW